MINQNSNSIFGMFMSVWLDELFISLRLGSFKFEDVLGPFLDLPKDYETASFISQENQKKVSKSVLVALL